MAGGRKKIAYPEKKRMNLYYKPDRTTVPATVSLYVLFALTLMLAFGKFMVYDHIVKLQETRERLDNVLAEKSVYDAKLENYDEVLQRYRLYSKTEDELNQTDRIEILDLLDEAVRPEAQIDSVSVSNGFVTVKFSGVTLRETAQIVKKLEESEIVARTSVDTASTTDSSGSQVTASILITLLKENEQDETTTVEP